jgi:hypothetical protein
MTTAPSFTGWLAETVGTRQWVVAKRMSLRLTAKGYTLAIAPARYKALEAEFNRIQAHAKAEQMLAELRAAAGEACSLMGSGSSATDRAAKARLKAAIRKLADDLTAAL